MAGETWFGTAGWSFADWAGTFYPRGEQSLGFYSDYFDCAEVNVTFYRPPDAKMSAGWAKQVEGKRFRFAVKLSQEFTHAGTWGAREAELFLGGIRPLEEAGRLGPILVQFPWSFRNSDATRARVARLAALFGGRELVVEVRHASWEAEAARAWLAERGLGWVNIDQPAIRDNIGPGAHVTGASAYVRLHGRNAAKWFARDIQPHERYDYYYTPEELEPWVERIRAMMAESKAVYVIGNNHYRGKAPANTLRLMSRVREKKVAVPEPLLATFPDLSEIAAKPPGRLF